MSYPSFSIERGKTKWAHHLSQATSTLVEHGGGCWKVDNATLHAGFCLQVGKHERLVTTAAFRGVTYLGQVHHLGQSFFLLRPVLLRPSPCLGQAYPQYSPCWCEGATEGQRRHSHKHCLCTPSDFQQAFMWSITGRRPVRF